MSAELITKEDLRIFRIQLLDDIRQILSARNTEPQYGELLKGMEVRKILKVSPGTLQNLRIAGKLKPVKVGGSWRYSLSEVQALVLNKKC